MATSEQSERRAWQVAKWCLTALLLPQCMAHKAQPSVQDVLSRIFPERRQREYPLPARPIQLTFDLPDGQNFCFHEHFERVGEQWVLEFRVLDGGERDVDINVYGPAGEALFGRQQHKGDDYYFKTNRGEYRFCFGNQFSTFSHKKVHFELRSLSRPPLAQKAGEVKDTAQTQLENSLDRIGSHMEQVKEFQNDLKYQEVGDQSQSSGLLSHIDRWSGTVTTAIVVVSLLQTFFLKTLFAAQLAKHKNTSTYKTPV